MQQNESPERRRRSGVKKHESMPVRIAKVFFAFVVTVLLCLMLLMVVRVIIPVAGMYIEAVSLEKCIESEKRIIRKRSQLISWPIKLR